MSFQFNIDKIKKAILEELVNVKYSVNLNVNKVSINIDTPKNIHFEVALEQLTQKYSPLSITLDTPIGAINYKKP